MVAYVDFLNDRKESVDIYCLFHLGSSLYDSAPQVWRVSLGGGRAHSDEAGL